MLLRFFSYLRGHSSEECFYVDCDRHPSKPQLEILHWLLTAPPALLSVQSFFPDKDVVEIGPRLSVETPFSSSAVSICRSLDLPVCRVEKSTRHQLRARETDRENIIRWHLDPMTQEIYPATLTSFGESRKPEPVRFVDVLGRGEAAMGDANETLGLGMDGWDKPYWTEFFKRLGRNPTDVELFQIGNGNSEHSRHWFFRGIQIIDGVEMPESLMDIVKEPWRRDPGRSLVAFHDNGGVLEGNIVEMFAPRKPGQPSAYTKTVVRQHFIATAETHNHPTLKAPFQGATTGSGGMERDKRAVGQGTSQPGASVAGYATGNLHIPGYLIPGEIVGGKKHGADATPLEILIQGSNGVSDYGNKLGVPLIGGFCRPFGQVVNGEVREFRKPVLYCGGTSRLLDQHIRKHSPQVGMLIVRIGGPAYRIGVGGGSASSMISGTNDAALDLKSVQRGNAEMENRANRVIQTCAELLDQNPIASIHDQGAGGPSNVLTELMEPVGGMVDIRKITVGDQTMSVLELWVAEFQEGYGLLIRPEHIELFRSICEREHVNCEVLGEITGDGNVVVLDSSDNTTPVDLSLKGILGELPRKRFESDTPTQVLKPLVIPKGLTVEKALEMVLKLASVCSKGFLVHKADRSVTGLVVRQQCCGPTQVPVSDVSVTADGYFDLTGLATALGEQPLKMLINSEAGARMKVAEMLTNMTSAGISRLSDLKCRANWMWAAKRPGQGALLYRAAVAMRNIMLQIGIAIDGGKDSLSMATQVGDELVVAPGELVIMGYAPVPDITKVVTPDLKVGMTSLMYIDLGQGKNRLGGSALAQALGQLGDESPDIDDPDMLRRAFEAVQELIEKKLINAYHDVSDGGLITTITEMCIAGNCGASISFDTSDILATLFHEEAGMVIGCRYDDYPAVKQVLQAHDIRSQDLGVAMSTKSTLTISLENGDVVLNALISELRAWWEATSDRLELEQTEHVVAAEGARNRTEAPEYRLTYEPKAPNLMHFSEHKVAIVREQGTNGEREMAAAFHTVGFEAHDITMSDLKKGRVTSLDAYRGLVLPGGFSYADVFGSATGWAASIRFNSRLRNMFDRFYERPDTFSLGVCNGFQWMQRMGWLLRDTKEASQPRLVHNKSARFESRWIGVRILPNPAIMLRGMEGSVLGVNAAHGEGQLEFSDPKVVEYVETHRLACLEYVDPDGNATECYPYNPNGSARGWGALCSPCGRHLGMMPHPERSFLPWQWPWMPEEFRNLKASPWLQMFQNAHEFVSNS
ncbi:MAG: purL [Candidatus Kaiserbacteria bacterium]|nr:purL [Candidatus Kaiserbacteria bacterium]